jgi:hypothetical protein
MKEKKAKSSLAEAERRLSQHLDGSAVQFMVSQLSSKQRHWSNEMKKYCFSIYYKSPSCYRYLRKTFRMPSVRTLQRLTEGITIKCGFSPEFQRVLSAKVKDMSEMSKYCVLCLDEMAIQAGLSYDPKMDAIIGFEDLGDCGKSQSVAKQALVFMVCGMFENWKQPIGCFAVSTSAPGEILKNLIVQAIKFISDTGLIPKVVIMDQGPNNQKAMRLLGVSVDQPFIVSNNRQVIFFMYDPPHLLKSVRNQLFMHDFIFDGKIVSWSHIRQLYDLESKKKIVATRLVPKLTQKHVELPPFSKMKVKTATHVCSNTAHAAILTYVCGKKMPEDATHTAKFLKMMDSLFDVFNSNKVYDSKPLRCALKDYSPGLKYLDVASKLLNKITVLDLRTQPPCNSGWRMSINALKMLFNDLKTIFSDDFYLCKQDSLEKFFSLIRASGPFLVNPNFKKFTDAYKRVAIKNCVDQSSCSNCEADLNSILLDAFSSQNDVDDNGDVDMPNSTTDESESHAEQDFVTANMLFYIAGYTFSKYLKRHVCRTCSNLFIKQNAKFSNPTEMFTFLKSYDNSSRHFGGLCVPTDCALSIISQLEDVFISKFVSLMHADKVCCKLVTAAFNSIDFSFVEDPSCRQNLKVLVQMHLRMRIYYSVKFFNCTIKQLPRNKQNRKALILQHL